jgi:hypothetical protein
MRTELTYAVDQIARYNGDNRAAVENVTEYYRAGGLSEAYFRRVCIFMQWVDVATNNGIEFIPAKWRKRMTKALRKKMPRVHTEASNWRLNYNIMLAEAAHYRKAGKWPWAKSDVLAARHIRQMYL